MSWQLATGMLTTGSYPNTKPCIMAIVNLTPDSFSDGGSFIDPNAAVAEVHSQVAQGANVIDLGAESTRPGAPDISAQQQLARLQPVLRQCTELSVPISIDTSNAEVIRELADHPRVGAINDVRALTQPNALAAVANSNLGVCLMHMQGTPKTMQLAPIYTNLVVEIKDYLDTRAKSCVDAGIASTRICIDPGFGFGKTVKHNIELFHSLAAFTTLTTGDYPLLVAVSRKSMFAEILGNPKRDRTLASAFAAALAWQSGAGIVRVHDVASTIDAINTLGHLGQAHQTKR